MLEPEFRSAHYAERRQLGVFHVILSNGLMDATDESLLIGSGSISDFCTNAEKAHFSHFFFNADAGVQKVGHRSCTFIITAVRRVNTLL